MTSQNLTKNPLFCGASRFNLGRLRAFLGADKPTKDAVATERVTNKRLFRKLYFQTMPGKTKAFLILSSDYNVLRSTAVVLNNFIQYSHCQVV